MSTFQAGQILRAALLEALVPLFVEKTADETVTSSTVLQNDDELVINNIPIGTWELSGEFFALGTSATAQDIKYAWTFPTGVISWSGIGYSSAWASGAGAGDVNASGVVNTSSSPTNAQSFGCVTGQNVPTHVKGHLVTTAIGSLQLQWAQDTSNATGTTLKTGSWFSLRRLVIPT